MAQLRSEKYVNNLPVTLTANTLYYVKVGAGFDLYVTNDIGTVIAYPLNVTTASGGTNSFTQTVDFGSTFSDKAQAVVTGLSYVNSTKEIVGHIKTSNITDPDEIRLLNFSVVISNIIDGVGFTITVYSETEAKGTYEVMCIIN